MTTAGLLDLMSGAALPTSAMPPWMRGIAVGLVLALCLFICVIDARHRIIPDPANATLAALGLVAAAFGGRDMVLAALLQGAVCFALFWAFRAAYHRLRGFQGLGFGDVKFLGAAGIWVGVGGIAPLVLIACVAALAFVGFLRWRGEAVTGRYALPFGPFLAIGLMAMLVATLIAP